MSIVRAFFPGFGVAVALTFAEGGDRLAFKPEDGSAVTKHFDSSGEFALDEISLIVNGQDVAGMVGQIDMSVEQGNRIEVTDTYERVADGRPAVLLRKYEVLAGNMRMDMTPAQAGLPEIVSSSPLEGKTVAFRWNEEEQAYERAFGEEGGDQDWLDGLEEDMDLRAFLPRAEVAAGDSWTVELMQLRTVVMPGGNLRMTPEGMDVDEDDLKMFEELFGDFGEEFGDLLEGECTCTYKGTREEDGVRVAEIDIALEVAASLDLSDLLEKVIHSALEESGVNEMVEFTLDTADVSLDFEGAGTLLWSVGAGRMHSFELNGDMTFGMDLSVGIEVEGESQGVDASLEFSGSMRQVVSTTE